MDIYLYSKQNRSGVVKRNIDTIENAPFCPGMTRQIHRFLGCSRPFDRNGRLGEQAIPCTNFRDKAPGVVTVMKPEVEGSPFPPHLSENPSMGYHSYIVPGATDPRRLPIAHHLSGVPLSLPK